MVARLNARVSPCSGLSFRVVGLSMQSNFPAIQPASHSEINLGLHLHAAMGYYIIGTHSNNVLIWFTKRILGTVFLCPYNVSQMTITHILSNMAKRIGSVFCHSLQYAYQTLFLNKHKYLSY